MDYKDIGEEMLKDIKNTDELVERYNLNQYKTLDLLLDNDLIKVLNTICCIKDELEHRNEEKTSTNKVNKRINLHLGIN